MDPDLKLQPSHLALFCACMEGIVHYLEYETEPETMAPFLTGRISVTAWLAEVANSTLHLV